MFSEKKIIKKVKKNTTKKKIKNHGQQFQTMAGKGYWSRRRSVMIYYFKFESNVEL